MKQLFLALASAALVTTGCHSTDDGNNGMNTQGHMNGSATGTDNNNGMNGMDTSGHAPSSPSGVNPNGSSTLSPN
ncbi:MAG TPA: hypothetical protein VH255_10590 [Verrucomicrobiae bacterium]|jgi:hypothetical protein|nr:hypothetical protein [Verrucomicrobiae bacterium]